VKQDVENEAFVSTTDTKVRSAKFPVFFPGIGDGSVYMGNVRHEDTVIMNRS